MYLRIPDLIPQAELLAMLAEEAADTELCMRMVHALDNRHEIEMIKGLKYQRWMERLSDGRTADGTRCCL